ncbi:hypothetical protein C0585_01240 [Candidatus Woesearchaeota archaeon]|nr:MAG: hypothetical protein C0585_01240 [Candidatus Woesearchaeota archaeon]
MKISFNKNFYSKKAIETAIKDFNEFIISFNQEDFNLNIEFNEEVFDEFCNYVLGLSLNDR